MRQQDSARSNRTGSKWSFNDLGNRLATEKLEARTMLANCAGITDVAEYSTFHELSADSVSCLSAAQLASIPDGHWFGRLSTEALESLSTAQVQSLLVERVGIRGLSTEQVADLTVKQIQSLDQIQFRHLRPEQIPLLTAGQVASIPDQWWFTRISEESRAAFTSAQVPHFDLHRVGIKHLTASQISHLSQDQVRSLTYHHFGYLNAKQATWLSEEQLATIPSRWWLNKLTVEARAALNADQVRAIDVAAVGLRSLTPNQIANLSVAQIQSLRLDDFRYLAPSQAAQLTTRQMELISSNWWFTRMTVEARAALTETQVRALNAEKIGIDLLTSQQVSHLTAEQIGSLSFRQFRFLDANQVAHLSGKQLSTIPNAWWFSRIPEAARGALNASQVRALNIANVGVAGLTEQQVSFLSASPVAAVEYKEFHHLKPTQIPSLTPAQIRTIPNAWWFQKMSDEARAALASEQVRALNVAEVGVNGLTLEQKEWLTTEQIQSLSFQQIRYLPPTQVADLAPLQVADIPSAWWFTRMTDAARAALTRDQVQALRVADTGIGGLTREQIDFLSPQQVQSLPSKEFRYLTEKQIVWVTPEQLAGMTQHWPFQQISESARAAMTADQVRAINVQVVPVSQLTPDQIEELSVQQIQALGYKDFRYLNKDQIVLLTESQLRELPDSWWFTRIPADVRAQLSDQQVRHLLTDQVSIQHLTPGQRAALTSSQIRMAKAEDLRYLQADQVQHVTVEQIRSIASAWHLKRIPADVRGKFNRDQVLAVDEAIMADMVGLPTQFAVTEAAHAEHARGMPHSNDAAKQLEHMAALSLVPHDQADYVTSQSGPWSDPATWRSQSIPTVGADVLIQQGHRVIYDAIVSPSKAVDTIRVDGRLEFAHDIDTQLSVDTLVVAPEGRLQIGTDDRPIRNDVVARLVFVGDAAIDPTWDPLQLSRGLVSHGEVEMHGEEVTPYAALKVDPLRGARELVLESVPDNWEVGDRLVLTGVHSHYSSNQDEELEILSIDGNRVSIDADVESSGQQPLAFDHRTPDGDDGPNSSDPANLSPDGDTLKVYVANVNRNVVLMSESPDENSLRGHVMFMHNQNVDIDNVGFYGLGRTDKRNPINDPQLDEHGNLIAGTGLNPQGRYAVHFHRAGTSYEDTPGWLAGSAIVDSPGWGVVNHESYVHAHNNVAFHVVGASFVTELGNEIGSFVGNLSINNSGSGHGIQSREEIFDFGHGGHGFWAQGPLVEFNDNIAAGSREAAFVFFTQSDRVRIDADLLSDATLSAGRDSVPVGSVSLKSVEGNTAFASKRGLETWFHQTHMNDGQTHIGGLTAWNTRSEAVFTPYTGRTTISDATLVGNLSRPRGIGIGRNHVTNQMTYEDVTALGFDIGISIPVNRQTIVRDGRFAAVRAIQIDRARDSIREVDIVGNPQFDTLDESQLNDRKQFDVYMHGGFQMDNFDLETLFTPDITRLGTIRFQNQQIFYVEQAASFVPFQDAITPDFVPAELVGLTNAELSNRFGIALAGAIPLPEAQEVPRINGLLGQLVNYPQPLELLSAKYSNQLQGYQLAYLDADGNRIDETIDLHPGWNLVTREVNGSKRTLFVFGDAEAPTFALLGTPAVNPDGLRAGITIHGKIFDNSTGLEVFKRRIKNLETLPVIEMDGRQYLKLEFDIKDLAGNTTPVVVHIHLDPNAPFVPGTDQEDLPQRVLPITLYELLRYFTIR